MIVQILYLLSYALHNASALLYLARCFVLLAYLANMSIFVHMYFARNETEITAKYTCTAETIRNQASRFVFLLLK